MTFHHVAVLLGLILAGEGCASRATPTATRPQAATTLRALGDRYADLERLAESMLATADSADGMGSERAHAEVRQLAGQIALLRGGFEDVTVAMTTDQLMRTQSLWYRMGISEAALELLHQDAIRLSEDLATSPAELHELAAQLSGALELGRVSSRMAARRM
jgi:outer membrane murein-binding lipoprotein Lpp